MAEQTLTANRRGFIGGAAVIAVSACAIDCFAVPAAGASVVASRAAWEAALAQFARAKAGFAVMYEALTQAEGRYYALRPERPSHQSLPDLHVGNLDEWKARAKVVQDDLDRWDELARRQAGLVDAEAGEALYSSRLGEAIDALMLCPAPDLAAVAYKIELAKTEGMNLRDIEPALCDLRRLAGEADKARLSGNA